MESLREIANKVNFKSPIDDETHFSLLNFFDKIVATKDLVNSAYQGNYSCTKHYKTICDRGVNEYNTKHFISKNIPYLSWTHESNGVKAHLKTEFKEKDTKYEWFLSHERTTEIYNPRIEIYMVFEW